MNGVNLCTFVGNVGADPEVRSFDGGGKIATLKLAVSESWKDKSAGERKEKTEWIPVTFNGKIVDTVEMFVKKGSTIYVEGKFRTRKYQDQNGTDKFATSIVARGFQFVGKQQQSEETESSTVAKSATTQEEDNSLPF